MTAYFRRGSGAFVALTGLLVALCGPISARAGDDPPSGARSAYLDGLIAQDRGEPERALEFYRTALARDPRNHDVESKIFNLALGEGQFDVATALARQIVVGEPEAPLPTLTLVVAAIAAGDGKAARERAAKLPDNGFMHYLRGFVRGWTALADKAPVQAALDAATDGGETRALGTLNDVQLAMMADVGHDTATADAHYGMAVSQGHLSLRVVELAGNFFERTGHRQRAKDLYDGLAAGLSAKSDLLPSVSVPAAPAPLIRDARDGLAETLFQLASLMGQDAASATALVVVRLSLELRPNFAPAQLILGEALAAEHRSNAALAALRAVPASSPYAHIAQLREAALLEAGGQGEAAAKLLRALAAANPGQIDALVQLANQLRRKEKYLDAASLYTAALDRLGGKEDSNWWALYYDRGTCYERAGDWARAETDLRFALRLAPNEPELLNYLGYALVDRQQHLDEALELIRRAVAQRPDDGYFVDSLGWAYFRQGNLAEARTQLERAVELKPADADINAHLGDAYWQSGKASEARLQWRRALSLNPAPPLAQELAQKLEMPEKPGETAAPDHRPAQR